MRATNAWRSRLRLGALAAAASVCFSCLWVNLQHGPALAAEDAAAATSRLAGEALRRAGVRRGVCAVLGGEKNLPLELCRASELLVHVREPDSGAVAELRRAADAAGLGLERLVVERGSLERLPHADNLVDLVVAARAGPELLAALRAAEVVRVLRPEGTAVIGAAGAAGERRLDARRLDEWARGSGAEGVETWEDAGGVWVAFRKPPLSGADSWSHWEHGPDNNPVSADQVIKAPYMTQFLAEPFYIGMPSITTVAAGRTFLAIGHIAHHRREWDTLYRLIARNGYNGTVLWERRLPEGYLVHRSAFIATRDAFYMLDGNGCLVLDPESGREKGSIRIPGVDGEWKWMAMKDGVLYVLSGRKGPEAETMRGDRSFGGWSWDDLSQGYYVRPRIPYGFGDTLVAYHLGEGRTLWTHREESPIDSRALALEGGSMYVYCPEKHLRALEADTGKPRWTNTDPQTLELIEQPGRGLTSTPGFRTACMTLATPEALIIQGQTQMNVIAVSTRNGYLLWTKKKITNNPNAIFVDGRVVLGVGPGGSHVAVDPVSGEVRDDFKFGKVACTRLTASSDSFFVRGEGTLRFDRASKKLLVDGAIRPACNDGALPANGLLYLGPWQCDCNLSLIGHMAKCSAGIFRFDHSATDAERLEAGTGDLETIAAFPITSEDWPTFRGDNRRGSGARSRTASSVKRLWEFAPPRPCQPAAPVAAGGLVFAAGGDGKVRALDAGSGDLRWEFAAAGPVKAPPALWEGRVYFGSGDGHAYCLEAATGRLLWRFRAAPVERHIMVYGALSSTWPVQSGVLVQDGIAYFAAGIIDHDGTYVYAVDARTGKLRWQNNSSGHLSEELRKGVSAQGNLTIAGDLLLLAGGNQVSPAPYKLATGECLAGPLENGRPKANAGQFVGVFRDGIVIEGGRILYSSPQNVPTKGSFVAITKDRTLPLCMGGIPPAWSDSVLVLVNFKHGKIACIDAGKAEARITRGLPERQGGQRGFGTLADAFLEDGAVRWQQDLGEAEGFEALSLAVAPNAVVAVVEGQDKFRAQPQWFLVALDLADGKQLFRQDLRAEPLPGGLLIDRAGRIVVRLLDGRVACYGPEG